MGGVETLKESLHSKLTGRKIPCCTQEWNLHQQHAGLTLYQLSYTPIYWQTPVEDACTYKTQPEMTLCS